MRGPPKFLLDTNVFRLLAHGDLRHYERRLRTVTEGSCIRLWWVPEVAVQELFSRVAEADETTFGDLRTALWWADVLAGNQLAEGYDYAIRSGTSAYPLDWNERRRIALNQARRRIIKATSLSDIPDDLVQIINSVRKLTSTQRSNWAKITGTTIAKLKHPPSPDDEILDGAATVTRVIDIYGCSVRIPRRAMTWSRVTIA